jgi:hypothetical protein
LPVKLAGLGRGDAAPAPFKLLRVERLSAGYGPDVWLYQNMGIPPVAADESKSTPDSR